MKTIHVGLALLVAAIACGAMGYFAGRASAQPRQPRLTENQHNATLPRDVHRDSQKVSSETYARALKALGEKNLIDMWVLIGDYTETAVLLTVNDVHLPYDVPSLMPVP